MKNFTLIIVIITLFNFAALSQRTAEMNTTLLYSFEGSIFDVQPYAEGVIFLANNGTNDFVGYSADGTNFSILESLEAGTVSNLIGWAGSNLSYYYGNKTSDGVGSDLRVNHNGTARLLWNESGGHDPSYPALTNAVRVNQGADGYRYYYLAQGEFNQMTGHDVTIYETDGTDAGTIEVEKELTNANPVNPNQRISIKKTHRNNSGILEGTMFNGHYYFLAGHEAANGMYTGIYYIDYDSNGSTARFLTKNENEVLEWSNIVATSSHIYVTEWYDNATSDERGPITAVDVQGQQTTVSNGNQLRFTNDKPIVYDDKLIAIYQLNNNPIKKLAIINSPSDVELYHINAENETDNISNITLSGNKLYFWASQTGSNDYYLYVMRLDAEGAQPVVADFIYEGHEVTSMQALADGGITYSSWSDESQLSMTKVHEGIEGTAYLVVDDDITINPQDQSENYTYSWNGQLNKVIAIGNEVYYFNETSDETSGNAMVKILKLNHIPAQEIKPNPIPETTFYRGSRFFNITDANTGEPIEGAEITLKHKNLLLDNFSETTGANGSAYFLWKPIDYYHYQITAPGYITHDYNQWATIWMKDDSYIVTEDDVENATTRIQLTPDGATAIGENTIKNIKLFPNPVSDILQIQSEASIISLSVYALTGTKVKQVKGTNLKSLDVSGLSSGIYLLVLTDTNGNQSTTKITRK